MGDNPVAGIITHVSEPDLLQDVKRLRQVLELDQRPAPTGAEPPPALVVLCGLPGTGKSHFARQLTQRWPSVVLGSDRLRKTLVSRPQYTPEEHRRVFSAAYRLLEELLAEGHRVIFDAVNLHEGSREPARQIARRAGVPLLLIQLTAPPGLVRRRLQDRVAGANCDGFSDADWQIYCNMRPAQQPVRGPHLLVDTSKDIGPALEEVLRWLRAAEQVS